MTTVSLTEARDRLAELIGRVAAGEPVVLTDGGKWVAQLAAPPPSPPTPEELAAAQREMEDAIRAIVQTWIDDGYYPPEDSGLWELMGRRP